MIIQVLTHFLFVLLGCLFVCLFGINNNWIETSSLFTQTEVWLMQEFYHAILDTTNISFTFHYLVQAPSLFVYCFYFILFLQIWFCLGLRNIVFQSRFLCWAPEALALLKVPVMSSEGTKCKTKIFQIKLLIYIFKYSW